MIGLLVFDISKEIFVNRKIKLDSFWEFDSDDLKVSVENIKNEYQFYRTILSVIESFDGKRPN